MAEKASKGRPGVTDIPLLTSVISQFKDRLFNEDGSVIGRSDPVWLELSIAFNEAIRTHNSFSKSKSSLSMYTYVVCNKNGIRSELKPRSIVDEISTNSELLENECKDDSMNDASLDLSATNNINSFSFLINVQGCDFDNLTEARMFKDKSRPNRTRKRLRFKKDDWSRWCNEKIFSVTKISCGFFFHYHHIDQSGTSGHIAGHCNCGSLIDIIMHRNEENVVSLKCTVTNPKEKKKCGKIYLRGKERIATATTLQKKSTYKYRIEKLDEFMQENDDFEPAIVPKVSTFHTAKSQVALRSYLDPDPIQAVLKMKLTIMKNTIYNIGLSPVCVYYSTKHQDTVYKTLAESSNVSVAIDATGSIIRKIRRPDKSESGPIFFYGIVVKTSSSSCIVAQMISEKHNTCAITNWLNEWISNTGAPCPKEVVCDSSKALLAACVRSFTNSGTINKYADDLAEDKMPSCYIRIDVAHFIKNYADSFRGARKEIRKFYLNCIGRLIISEDIEEAKDIIHALFVVSLSDNDGPTISGNISECEKQKQYLLNLLSYNYCENLDISNVESDEDDDCDILNKQKSKNAETTFETIGDNKWSSLGKTLKQVASLNIEKSPGTRVNAHRRKTFSDRLLDDIKLLPLWSCVVRNKFGYGRVPATSAHVESEFNKIKNLLLSTESSPMRLDVFIDFHVKYLSGILKQFNVILNSENSDSDYQVSPTLSRPHDGLTAATQNVTAKCVPCTIELSDCNVLNNEQRVLIDLTSEIENEYNKQPKEKNISGSKSTCPACQQGDTPTGSHKCIVCGILVHALDLCSKPYGEEGYGQTRICIKCSIQNNFAQILESREQENWMGQVSKTTKKFKKPRNSYLKKKHSLQALTSKPLLTTIPILKMGDNKTLKAYRDGKQKIDFTNTCAFDALFQLFLISSHVEPEFYKNVQKFADKNPFFYLIAKSKNKITAQSYVLRSEILKNLYPKYGNDDLACYTVDCSTTIRDISQKLLRGIPSFVEIRRCENNHEKMLEHTSLTITKTSLILKMIEQELSVVPSTCLICDTVEVTTIEKSGNFVLFAVVPGFDEKSLKEINPEIALKDLPYKIRLFNETLYLRGLIHFQSSYMTRTYLEKKDLNEIGHYTTFYYKNGRWSEYDLKEKKRPDGFKVNPELIMYSTSTIGTDNVHNQ